VLGINGAKSKVFFAIIGLSLLIPAQAAWAAEPQFEFTRIDGDDISTNPVAQSILQKIELSKKIFAELKEQQTKPQITEHQKFIEEQRKLTQQQLQQDLVRMNKNYEPFTPRNAYASFLGGVDGAYHDLYWGQFNYMYDKVQLARAAKEQILANGGTFQEAFTAYVKYASMTKVELIKVNQELNIKYGFANPEIQKTFDKYGKLPRFDDT